MYFGKASGVFLVQHVLGLRRELHNIQGAQRFIHGIRQEYWRKPPVSYATSTKCRDAHFRNSGNKPLNTKSMSTTSSLHPTSCPFSSTCTSSTPTTTCLFSTVQPLNVVFEKGSTLPTRDLQRLYSLFAALARGTLTISEFAWTMRSTTNIVPDGNTSCKFLLWRLVQHRYHRSMNCRSVRCDFIFACFCYRSCTSSADGFLHDEQLEPARMLDACWDWFTLRSGPWRPPAEDAQWKHHQGRARAVETHFLVRLPHFLLTCKTDYGARCLLCLDRIFAVAMGRSVALQDEEYVFIPWKA